jgi:copper chaperone NosL
MSRSSSGSETPRPAINPASLRDLPPPSWNRGVAAKRFATMTRLHPLTRLVLAIAVLSLVSAYFVPLWQIQLWAPQYPEGLNMKIWIDNLTGAFDIINGLNHYIGMAMIKLEMFPEFGFMIYVLGALIALGLLAVAMGTRKWLWAYVIVLALGGLAGLVDFYRWGYQYGHNLDSNAAIQVPGMTYQPPLVGYKNLLNFTAYSGPDIGGWIMIVSGCTAGLLLGWEQFLRKGGVPCEATSHGARATAASAAGVAIACCLGSCHAGPEPMRYGQDECTGCKMIISDRRFGAEIVTRKGKVLKFDDIGCMNDFIRSGGIAESQVKLRMACDFNRPNVFIPVEQAFFFRNEMLKSPMRSDSAAFVSELELRKVREQLGEGQLLRWPAVVSTP